MKRAILLCNGDINDLAFHQMMLRSDDTIIAVDGGGKHCLFFGVLPQIVVGDFDSLNREIRRYYQENHVEMLTYPRDKDYIDFALALDIAIERGFREILVFGALGGKRIDMEIGNLLLLSRYDADITIVDEYREVRSVRPGKTVEVKDRKGEYLSLIPLSPTLKTGESCGLKYQLKDLSFSFGETRSISNEITSKNAFVEIKEGKALLICQKK